MAILVVKIENTASLQMNEFFDFNGQCYAISRSRLSTQKNCIELEAFYEATVISQCIHSVPVVFVVEEPDPVIVGWYMLADVYRECQYPSMFLEGNIIANAKQAVLLPEDQRILMQDIHFESHFYEVIEAGDVRFDDLMGKIHEYCGKNSRLLYDFVDIHVIPALRHEKELCLERCMLLAERLMNDACQDIREIKELAIYSELLIRMMPKQADGYYYQAMAYYQAGQHKKAIKAIEKALKIEDDAADLMAMKGHILVNMGYISQAAEWFHEACLVDGDEDYLILEGRAWMIKGQMDKALQCFSQVQNKDALKELGINLKDMEKRWPFIQIRHFNLKELFSKKK